MQARPLLTSKVHPLVICTLGCSLDPSGALGVPPERPKRRAGPILATGAGRAWQGPRTQQAGVLASPKHALTSTAGRCLQRAGVERHPRCGPLRCSLYHVPYRFGFL